MEFAGEQDGKSRLTKADGLCRDPDASYSGEKATKAPINRG